ncbi:MAG: prolipoprotein diacylglyceryl transferase [Candidatus Woesearchaeota archaeon]|jgi:phosphatidylglycerol:prolipoprotein diacylglycerol transferase
MVYYFDLSPVIFSIGPFSLRYYGLFYAIGVFLVYLALYFAAKYKLVRNITEKNYDDVFLWIVVGCILGARLGHILFFEPVYYFSHPLEMFAVWHGGMSFHGAIIGMGISFYFLCKKYKIKFLDLADLIVIPAAFGLCLGRIGNFMNGELIGTKTSMNLCVQYSGVDGCRHFSQFYESAKNLFIGIVLLFMYKSKKLKSGVVFFSFIFLYGILRFLLNFYRDDIRYFGLSTGQYLCIVMVVISSIWFIKNRQHCLKSSHQP